MSNQRSKSKSNCEHKNTLIYFASALFNSRELVNNSIIEQELVNKGYRVFLPQRDGFEFSKLTQILENVLDSKDVNKATEDIIYILDMGWALQNSQIVIGNYDEPMDPGVIVEMCYAMFACNKPVIGYRTDTRSPYGVFLSELGGQHFFPPYNTHTMIMKFPNTGPNSSFDTIVNDIKDISNEIDTVIKDNSLNNKCHICIKRQSPLKNLINATNLLFKNILDGDDIYDQDNYQRFIDVIHTTEGLTKIAKNWEKYHLKFKLRPRIINQIYNNSN
jgi:nucleoside 2-deoxyribosyltransferase